MISFIINHGLMVSLSLYMPPVVEKTREANVYIRNNNIIPLSILLIVSLFYSLLCLFLSLLTVKCGDVGTVILKSKIN